MFPFRPTSALLAVVSTSCYLMPYPDHHLTKREAAWGKVKRGEPYMLVRDFTPQPDYNALRDSSCAGVDDVGLLVKGTAVKFTGFCVRRNYWGSQPFVYAEVLGGPYAGKTFYARGLVETEKRSRTRTTRIVDIRREAVKPAW